MTSPATYQIDDRPCIIGEVPAIGLISGASGSEQIVNNPNELYEGAYQHGWQGVMCWTSNGVDRFGNLSNFKAATRAFNANHHKLVYPDL
jgi:hypothetical protein